MGLLFPVIKQCQQVKKKICAFLALPRQKPGFPLQSFCRCAAKRISATIPCAPRASSIFVSAYRAQKYDQPGFPLQFREPLRGLRDFRCNPLRPTG
jgi:hypothetical protein